MAACGHSPRLKPLGALPKWWSYYRSVLTYCAACAYIYIYIYKNQVMSIVCWLFRKKLSTRIGLSKRKCQAILVMEHGKLDTETQLDMRWLCLICMHATKSKRLHLNVVSNCVHHVKEARLSLACAIGATQASQGDCLWTNSKVHILILWDKGHRQVILGYQRQTLIAM